MRITRILVRITSIRSIDRIYRALFRFLEKEISMMEREEGDKIKYG